MRPEERSARKCLAGRLEDTSTAKDQLTEQLAAAQQQLASLRGVLAAKEREAAMLAEQLRRAETRVEGLTEEKLAWLEERGALEQRAQSAERQAAVSGPTTTS